jgi:hypothetical protein
MLVANAGIAHQYKGAILMTAINKICLKVPTILYLKTHVCLFYKSNSAVVSGDVYKFCVVRSLEVCLYWLSSPYFLHDFHFMVIHIWEFLSKESYIAWKPILATVKQEQDIDGR